MEDNENNADNQLILREQLHEQQNRIQDLINNNNALNYVNNMLHIQLQMLEQLNNQMFANHSQLVLKNKINENVMKQFNTFIDDVSLKYFKFLINPNNDNDDKNFIHIVPNVAKISIDRNNKENGIELEITNSQLLDFLEIMPALKNFYKDRMEQEVSKIQHYVEIVKKKQKDINPKKNNDENLTLKYQNEELRQQNKLLQQNNDELANKEKKLEEQLKAKKFKNLIVEKTEDKFPIDKTKTKRSEYNIDNQNFFIEKAYENKKENKFDNKKIYNKHEVAFNIVGNKKKYNSVPTYNKNYKLKTYVHNRDGSVYEVTYGDNGKIYNKYNPLKSIQNKKRLVRNGILPRNINNAWLRQYHKNQKHGFDRF